MQSERNKVVTQFTPGPWRTDGFRIIAQPKGFEPTKEHPVFVVAQTCTYCSGTSEEQQANGRLIVQAPELLADLKAAYTELQSEHGLLDKSGCSCSLCQHIKATIAKAERDSQ